MFIYGLEVLVLFFGVLMVVLGWDVYTIFWVSEVSFFGSLDVVVNIGYMELDIIIIILNLGYCFFLG